MPSGNVQHKKSGEGSGSRNRVPVYSPGIVVGQHNPKTGELEFRPLHALVDHIPHRMLHKSVVQNELQRGDVAGYDHKPDAQQVFFPACSSRPERWIHKKGQGGLNGEQGAKNVSHIHGYSKLQPGQRNSIHK